ncbi:hypothetical protein BKA70DRAFT_1522050 [Coprinopsis sp. MPI-PUGE-AT-0042]|nr:hypothetical protein BKA70DRAFT_1522050 [Coprinopsis sp. MPI-PUGE-AT-0042]
MRCDLRSSKQKGRYELRSGIEQSRKRSTLSSSKQLTSTAPSPKSKPRLTTKRPSNNKDLTPTLITTQPSYTLRSRRSPLQSAPLSVSPRVEPSTPSAGTISSKKPTRKILIIETSSGFKCSQCAQIFTRRDSAKRHFTAQHQKASTFACSFCPKVAAQKYNIVIHERIHTGERIACPSCPAMFTDNARMSKHRVAAHNYIPGTGQKLNPRPGRNARPTPPMEIPEVEANVLEGLNSLDLQESIPETALESETSWNLPSPSTPSCGLRLSSPEPTRYLPSSYREFDEYTGAPGLSVSSGPQFDDAGYFINEGTSGAASSSRYGEHRLPEVMNGASFYADAYDPFHQLAEQPQASTSNPSPVSDNLTGGYWFDVSGNAIPSLLDPTLSFSI